MKARLPKGFGGGGAPGNLQQIAMQAQKIQEDINKATSDLEKKEYTTSSGGGAVTVTVTGEMVVKSINIKPEVVDAEDVELLSDLIMAAVNEAIREASEEKAATLESLSGGFNIPGVC